MDRSFVSCARWSHAEEKFIFVRNLIAERHERNVCNHWPLPMYTKRCVLAPVQNENCSTLTFRRRIGVDYCTFVVRIDFYRFIVSPKCPTLCSVFYIFGHIFRFEMRNIQGHARSNHRAEPLNETVHHFSWTFRQQINFHHWQIAFLPRAPFRLPTISVFLACCIHTSNRDTTTPQRLLLANSHIEFRTICI